MATQYTYDDTYIVTAIPEDELEQAETDALTDLNKQGVTDEYYLEQMTKCLVYITLAGRQLETENMKEKADHYNHEYKRYQQMATYENKDQGVLSGTIGRG